MLRASARRSRRRSVGVRGERRLDAGQSLVRNQRVLRPVVGHAGRAGRASERPRARLHQQAVGGAVVAASNFTIESRRVKPRQARADIAAPVPELVKRTRSALEQRLGLGIPTLHDVRCAERERRAARSTAAVMRCRQSSAPTNRVVDVALASTSHMYAPSARSMARGAAHRAERANGRVDAADEDLAGVRIPEELVSCRAADPGDWRRRQVWMRAGRHILTRSRARLLRRRPLCAIWRNTNFNTLPVGSRQLLRESRAARASSC